MYDPLVVSNVVGPSKASFSQKYLSVHLCEEPCMPAHLAQVFVRPPAGSLIHVFRDTANVPNLTCMWVPVPQLCVRSGARTHMGHKPLHPSRTEWDSLHMDAWKKPVHPVLANTALLTDVL